MPENLFAACRMNGELVSRRVQLDGTIQDQVEGVFVHQAQTFFEGVDEEVPFDGRWKPDQHELLTMAVTPEAEILQETLNGNPIAVEPLDIANFANAGVKALFTSDGTNDAGRVLVQLFTGGQVLDRKITLFLQGNSFRRLTVPAFTLASSPYFRHRQWVNQVQELLKPACHSRRDGGLSRCDRPRVAGFCRPREPPRCGLRGLRVDGGSDHPEAH